MIFLLYIFISLVIMSALEYYTHRFTMHGRRFVEVTGIDGGFETHAKLHHGRFYRGFEGDADPAARHVAVDLYPSYVVVTLAPLWLLAMWASLWFGLTLVAVLALHAALWTQFHREMHEPAGRLVPRLLGTYYRFCYSYHRRHHERPCCNFNVLIPLFDLLHGTYGGLSRKEGRG